MSRTTKKIRTESVAEQTAPKTIAKQTATEAISTSEAMRLFLEALRDAFVEGRKEVATRMVDLATKGNATALKTMIDVALQNGQSDEASRIETLKRLSDLETEAGYYTELSEETAEGFPSGREPE